MNPFKQGLRAFKDGNLDNPHPNDTEDYKYFQLGFNKAYFRNQQRQKDYERKINKKNEAGWQGS